MREWEKDPQAVKTFRFDWGELTGDAPVVDPVTAATVTVSPAGGVTLGAPSIDASGRYVAIRATGGVHGTRYQVLCHVTTASGEQDEHTQPLLVLNE